MLQQAFVAVRGVLYACGFVLLWAWLAVSVRPFDARIPFTVSPLLGPVGVVVALLGALLAAWCIAAFIAKGRGTPAPFDPPREFVATGPYRYVRNPMYLGGLGVLLGAGLYLASPSIILLAGVFLALAHLFVIFYEEPTLARRFGESYQQYKAAVHRWLPRPHTARMPQDRRN
jgi:protein-S-isoprenylcysteine O-methyltransferase Ste14